ncbi:MAG: PepSY-associated TM helix domain-containing protein, partial [Allosphingosinicella sp.]
MRDSAPPLGGRDAGGAAPPAAAQAPERKKARTWWLVHQWAGLKLSIFLSFILFTGTLAVLSSEMDWLMRPAMRVAPSTVSGPVNWPAITENAVRARPDHRITGIEAPPASAFAATVTVERPDGSLAFLYAHPTTGAIQGEGHWVGAKRVLRNMHRHLNMPVWIGVPIVSSLALLLLVSLASSLVVYKKWWRGWLKPIRTRDARTGWGDFHRLAGVWSLWFVLLMIVTGLWYFAEQTVARAPNLPRPDVP